MMPKTTASKRSVMIGRYWSMAPPTSPVEVLARANERESCRRGSVAGDDLVSAVQRVAGDSEEGARDDEQHETGEAHVAETPDHHDADNRLIRVDPRGRRCLTGNGGL